MSKESLYKPSLCSYQCKASGQKQTKNDRTDIVFLNTERHQSISIWLLVSSDESLNINQKLSNTVLYFINLSRKILIQVKILNHSNNIPGKHCYSNSSHHFEIIICWCRRRARKPIAYLSFATSLLPLTPKPGPAKASRSEPKRAEASPVADLGLNKATPSNKSI